MQKLLSILIICSFLVTPCLAVLADNSVSETAPASPNTETTGASRNAVVVYQDNSKKQDKKSNELVETQDNSEGGYKPSKWEITKYLAKWFGYNFIYMIKYNFINDVKFYIMFYPLSVISQIISYLAWEIPSCIFLAKTGIYIPDKVSKVFNKNDYINTIGRHLYNVIPLTLSSFMFKWGRDLYFYLKTI